MGLSITKFVAIGNALFKKCVLIRRLPDDKIYGNHKRAFILNCVQNRRHRVSGFEFNNYTGILDEGVASKMNLSPMVASAALHPKDVFLILLIYHLLLHPLFMSL